VAGMIQNTGIFSFCIFTLCFASLPASGQSDHIPPTGPVLTPEAAYHQARSVNAHIPADIKNRVAPHVWGSPQNKEKKPENIQALKDSPELPQLPAYSGKSKFFHGYSQPTEKGWTNYQLTYLCKESPDDVKNWYQNAFNSYQWRTLRAAPQTLSANHKDGHICTVTIQKANEQGYKTQLGVYFTEAPSRMIRHN